MKRALLIVGGTLGGLGAVLAITPPQLGGNSAQVPMSGALPSVGVAPTASAAAPSASVEPSASPKRSAGAKPVATKPAGKPAATKPAAPAATKPASQGINGTFTGDPIDISYGIIQVAITVVNGKITDAQAVQTPSARNDRWTNKAVPVMRERTLAAQSSQITGVSGASYTSFGWYKSLQSALTKAGLPL